MGQAAALIVLRAYSGIHAGVGQEAGTVDLPIQRERITNFPVLRGPSLKGALRQAAQDKGMDKNTYLKWIFGPDDKNAPDHAGAVSVGDARLLLFPMRSLKGTFAWVSCPFAFRRLKRDLEDVGLQQQFPLSDPPSMTRTTVGICSKSNVKHVKEGNQEEWVVLEDYGLKVEAKHETHFDALAGELEKLILQPQTPGQPEPQAPAQAQTPTSELAHRLVVVADDLFKNFVSFCTEVVTRVHLDDDTKTVKRGQLWTEELLPAESVLTALLICSDDREKKAKTGMHLLEELKKKVDGRFQIGGNETVGYGLCHLSWVGPVDLTQSNQNQNGNTNPTSQQENPK
ncbi:MAG: type III-B CRISPR module RAMP protein Cmr4 [Bdellovibrionales bacterium]